MEQIVLGHRADVVVPPVGPVDRDLREILRTGGYLTRKFVTDYHSMMMVHDHTPAAENGEEGAASMIGITRGVDPNQNIIEER